MREIPGFPGYHCDGDGHVYTTRKGRDFHRMAPANHIPPTPGAKRKNVFVHQLVARTWVGEPPEGHQVNHRNACRDDNRAENLEWVTLPENVKDGWRRSPRAGEGHHMVRVPDETVAAIRSMRKDGIKRRVIAAHFGLPISTVKNLLSGRHRKNV